MDAPTCIVCEHNQKELQSRKVLILWSFQEKHIGMFSILIKHGNINTFFFLPLVTSFFRIFPAGTEQVSLILAEY